MAREFQAGATSKTILVFIRDYSVTNRVAGLTGLAYNTASLTAYYARPLEAAAAITLATLAAVTTAWSSGGFKEIDATNMPGWYRLDVPNAALASGVPEVGIALKGAANMEQVNLTIDLTGYDPAAAPSTVADIFAAVLRTQLTEAYAANGVAPTLEQGLFAIHQMMSMFAISGTALTVKKLDGSTTAFVVTLNDATTPTGATRA